MRYLSFLGLFIKNSRQNLHRTSQGDVWLARKFVKTWECISPPSTLFHTPPSLHFSQDTTLCIKHCKPYHNHTIDAAFPFSQLWTNQPTNCGPWNQLLKEAAKGRTDFQHLWELRNYWWVGKIHYWISPQGASFSSALGVYWLLVFVQLLPELSSPETQTKCGQLIHSSIYQPISWI